MNEPIRVMIVDDHAIVRNGIATVLSNEPDIQIVGEAVDGQEAVDNSVMLKPDVILMDILLPRMGGLQATDIISQTLPDTKVLIFSIEDNAETILDAFRLGARGYLLKTADPTEIVQAVRDIASGEGICMPHMDSSLTNELKETAEKQYNLSQRENEVLDLVSHGFTGRQIAEILNVSETTIGTYIHRSMEKLHVKNRAEAIAIINRKGTPGK
jgi:DNA-binding NarL/FixJ family response regulator